MSQNTAQVRRAWGVPAKDPISGRTPTPSIAEKAKPRASEGRKATGL